MRRLDQDVETVLFDEEQIRTKVKELGEKITEDYRERDLLVVGILKGAGVFVSDLIREIDCPLRIDFMVVSSYGNTMNSSGSVRIIKDLQQSVYQRDILLVEDLVDTGNTLHFLKRYLLNKGARSVEICTLFDKPARRIKEVDVKYCGFDMPDVFVVGYGIDYAERYRNLPYAASLKKEAIERIANENEDESAG